MRENELVELFAEGGHHYGEDGAEGADAEEELHRLLLVSYGCIMWMCVGWIRTRGPRVSSRGPDTTDTPKMKKMSIEAIHAMVDSGWLESWSFL